MINSKDAVRVEENYYLLKLTLHASLPNAGGGKTIHKIRPAPQIPFIIDPANVSSLFIKKNVESMHHMRAARDRRRYAKITLRRVLRYTSNSHPLDNIYIMFFNQIKQFDPVNVVTHHHHTIPHHN